MDWYCVLLANQNGLERKDKYSLCVTMLVLPEIICNIRCIVFYCIHVCGIHG